MYISVAILAQVSTSVGLGQIAVIWFKALFARDPFVSSLCHFCALPFAPFVYTTLHNYEQCHGNTSVVMGGMAYSRRVVVSVPQLRHQPHAPHRPRQLQSPHFAQNAKWGTTTQRHANVGFVLHHSAPQQLGW